MKFNEFYNLINEKEKIVAIVPGSYKPPHKGHLDMIKQYSKRADEVYVLISDPKKPRTTSTGKVITAKMSKKLFDLYLKKAGLKNYHDISSHTFRKTLEVWLMALGVDALPLTAHIGHEITTAAQYYVSPDIFSYEEKKQMRDIIGDLYGR